MANGQYTPEEAYLKKLYIDVQKLMILHVRATLEFYHYRAQKVNRTAAQRQQNMVQQAALPERRPQQQMMMSPSPPNTVSPQFPEMVKRPPSVEQKPFQTADSRLPDNGASHQQPPHDDQFPSFYKQTSGQMGASAQQPCPQFVSRPITRTLPSHLGQSPSYMQMYSPQNVAVSRTNASPMDQQQQPFTPQQLPMIMRNIQRNPEMIPHTYGQPSLSDGKGSIASMLSHPAAYRQQQQQQFYGNRGQQQQQPQSYAPLPPLSKDKGELFDGMVDWGLYLRDLPWSENKDDFWHINTDGVDATLDDLISMMDSSPVPNNFVFPPMGQAQMMQAPGII